MTGAARRQGPKTLGLRAQIPSTAHRSPETLTFCFDILLPIVHLLVVFVIASAFIACTFILCVGAMVVVVRDMQREDAETEQMYSISAPGETEMNELMTSAEMVAQARNIAAQRMVDRDHDFVSKHLA